MYIGICGYAMESVGMVTTTTQSDEDEAPALVPRHMPVVDVFDQLLNHSLHVTAVLVQQLLVALPVAEAHLDQLVHWSTCW